jgi:hypothetical protein
MCDVGPGPYDGSLPFLIQWTTPMLPGPAHGPVVRSLDGHSSTNLEPGQSTQWLAEAEAGRRTDGVLRGAPWL